MNTKTYALDTEELFTKLETAAEEKAEAIFRCVRSEKYEKILLADLKSEIRQGYEKISQVELTDKAYQHKRYRAWLDDYSKKLKEKTLKVDAYNNISALKDMRITEESSARYLINRK